MIFNKLMGPIGSRLLFLSVKPPQMYLTHYNLIEKPFELSPGPRFLWLGENHSESLATLKYGILENKGFLLLTGDVGVGKTALIHRLIQEIDPSTIIANIPDPGLNALDFFYMLASEFHMAKKFKSKGEFIIELKAFLQKTQSEQKNVLLIIDEAQQLKEEILEQVRLLSNIEMSDRKLINIFFVGQPEFTEMLMDDRNRAVRQRIVVSSHIDLLAAPETEQYIHHRLKVAGATRNIFTSDAVREIYQFSEGCPRLINIICDHALLSGYSAGLKIIDSDVIKDCEGDLRIPAGFALKKIDVQPMPVETIRPRTIEAQPRRSKFKELFAYASLFCVLGAVAIYVVLKSGLWSTTPSYEQPYSPQQLVEQSTTNRSPSADEKITSDATADKSPSPELPASVNRLTQFNQKQDSPSSELQGDKFEIVDQTMTISPGQSLPAPNASSTGNDLNSVVSLPNDKSNNTAVLGTMPDSEVKPSLETAFQSRDEDAQVETNESSSDKIKRIIGEMAASQSRASPPEQEEGFVASKNTSEGQVPVTKEESPANVSSEIRPEPTDTVKAKPPVKPPPAQTADLSPPAKSTPSTKPVLKKRPSKQPVKKKQGKAGNKMARVETAPSSEEKTAKSRLEDRLRSFLQNYCSTYAAKDLAKFTDFFISGAQENGKPFVSLLPKYQKNFDQIEAIQYRIELKQYKYDSQNETVRIEGNFLLKWLPPGKKWRENSGKIFMNLKDDGRSFLVQRLDYYGSRQAN
jgi:type II secretory pathway predicted ATPase ExeA